jgi:hypothetical protein
MWLAIEGECECGAFYHELQDEGQVLSLHHSPHDSGCVNKPLRKTLDKWEQLTLPLALSTSAPQEGLL